MKQKILVTAALPYANGSIHLGHLVEYCQTDMYVRALKQLGEDALFICADDAHGTPIELNAKKQGITPESLVTHYHEEHIRDFARFDVAFDHFSLTHNDSNRAIVNEVYQRLIKAGQIEEREIDGNFCEHDARFLPDRFLRGTCPRCKSADQYGDVCEKCGATYTTTEIIDPKCSLCGNTPVIRKSSHLFFKLSSAENIAFLRSFITSGALQPDIAAFVKNWIDGGEGLRDWCITRDGPYFGFPVPGKPDKFFYVWLDAPLGYVASSAEWAEKHGLSLESLWQSPNTRIEHVIGKDIIYFHTLFWPAVLKHAKMTIPSRVHVHGMLTINGEKMSKSRGTFINAAPFADVVDAQALRFYYACKASNDASDLDLSFDDFVQRINSELVNKHVNLFSRATRFLQSRLGNQLGELPSTDDVQALMYKTVALGRQIETHYRNRELSHVMRLLGDIADIGNEYMQSHAPWDQMKTDPEAARLTCTFAVNICHALAMYLSPVVPRLATAMASCINADISRMDAGLLFALKNRPIGEITRLFDRIEKEVFDTLIASTASAPVQETELPEPDLDRISIDTFGQVKLRVGHVLQAEPVPKSNKLLKLMIDLGEKQPRQILAGIAQHYTPDLIRGRKVVVVANLHPAKLMGLESQGMVLAVNTAGKLIVVDPGQDALPGTEVR